jgi:hypothetical protein
VPRGLLVRSIDDELVDLRGHPCSVIQRLGLAQHLVAEEGVQRLRHVQVHLSTQEARKIIFDLRQREVCVSLVGLELDEYVDVALGPEVIAEDGPE